MLKTDAARFSERRYLSTTHSNNKQTDDARTKFPRRSKSAINN
jgi:hypothetical protein